MRACVRVCVCVSLGPWQLVPLLPLSHCYGFTSVHVEKFLGVESGDDLTLAVDARQETHIVAELGLRCDLPARIKIMVMEVSLYISVENS